MNVWLLVLSLLCGGQSAAAKKVAREIAEAFGRETLELAEPRIAKLVETHGDEVGRILRKVGPPGVPAMEKFGAAGMKILAGWGDDGLRLLAAEGDDAVAALGRYGEKAVELMIRHPGVGKDLLAHFGGQALRARLTTESVVYMNRLADPIRISGRAGQIFQVIERFGDRACLFLWRNKGTLFLASVLTAFLADPQPYLDGVKQLVVQPVSEAAQEAVRRTNWTLVMIAAMALGSVGLGIRWAWASRRAQI